MPFFQGGGGHGTMVNVPPPKPKPAPPSGLAAVISHAVGNVGAATQHAVKAASTPHSAPRPSGIAAIASRAVGNIGAASQHASRSASTPHNAAPSRLAAALASQQPSGIAMLKNGPWERQALTAQVYSVWAALRGRGLLPPSAQAPNVVIDPFDAAGGMRPYTTGTSIHFAPGFADILENPKHPENNWAREVVVHELAHTAQNRPAEQSRTMLEGGAQAFAKRAAPDVYGAGFRPYSDTNYTGYTQSMNVREPNDWIMHRQFVPGAQAPKVNLPGTPSFRIAMGGLGRLAGSQVADQAALGAQNPGAQNVGYYAPYLNRLRPKTGLSP